MDQKRPLDSDDALMVRGIEGGARLTGLGRRKVWELVNNGALPHRRVGSAVLFVRDEIQAWIDAGCPCEPDAGKQLRAVRRKGGRP